MNRRHDASIGRMITPLDTGGRSDEPNDGVSIFCQRRVRMFVSFTRSSSTVFCSFRNAFSFLQMFDVAIFENVMKWVGWAVAGGLVASLGLRCKKRPVEI